MGLPYETPTYKAWLSKRQTGRTTRMLDFAISEIKKGKTVKVICACHASAKNMRDFFKQRCFVAGIPNLKEWRGWNQIEFTSIQSISGETNLQYMVNTASAAKHDLTLWDHFAIESSLTKAMRELHRWDQA